MQLHTAVHAENCPEAQVKVRKEINDLTSEELQTFFEAVRAIQKREQPDKPSPYDTFSFNHYRYSAYTHGVPIFLPYHRYMLHVVEQELQKKYPSVTIPYWDWTAVSQAPETASIFSPEMFGGNGRCPHSCVEDGVFKDFKPFYYVQGQTSCIQRIFDGGNGKIKPFPIVEHITSMIANSKDWHAFSTAIQITPHGRAHVGLGGGMNTMFSPNDPVFYLHHAFIDKMWYDWQKINPGARVYQYGGQVR
ncbi:hypothetical protein SYNPS1DRAFT_13505, partial [Syncephalis pseudoplumigaleata]